MTMVPVITHGIWYRLEVHGSRIAYAGSSRLVAWAYPNGPE